MKKIIRYILLLLLTVFLLYIAVKINDVIYGINQLKGQLHIVMNARPVDEVMADSSITPEVREKLMFIQAVRKYAVDSIGLKDSRNYTTFYDQQNKPVLWVLTASPAFELKSYEWDFPFLGKVPYKGFFEEEKGRKEQQLLKRRILDTNLSPAGGWSTLGFFKDPVLSGMLKRDEGRLAELIIHELVHATLYVPGSAEFNENLATFIGEQGAIRFLKNYFGDEAAPLKEYLFFKEDEDVFGRYMLTSANALDSLYSTFGVYETFPSKLEKKYLLILKIVQGIPSLPLHYSARYSFTFPGNKLPDNTWFNGYRTYRAKQTDMEGELKAHDGDLKNYVRSFL